MSLRIRPLLLAIAAGTLVGPAPSCPAGDGQLVLNVVDAKTGGPAACRMTLKNVRNRPVRPNRTLVWNDHFVIPGRVMLKLPVGSYAFELERGPEYPILYGRFQINDFADDAKTITLNRHVDMAAAGWYSADLDVRRPPDATPLLMQSEDLHVAMVLAWANEKVAKPLPKEPLAIFDATHCAHLLGGSVWNRGGALLILNAPSPAPLAATAEYAATAALLEEIRRREETWVDLARASSWDLPLLVALGRVDSVQLATSQLTRDRVVWNEKDGRGPDRLKFPDPWGIPQWSQEIYFHLLNCGLKLPPSAASGSGLSTNPPGHNRMYVHVEGDFSYARFWEAFRAGRVTITNGPLLQPQVEGQMPGTSFSLPASKELELEIGLTLSTRDPISYLEIIQNGRVVHSIGFKEYAAAGKLPPVKFDAAGWFLVRAVTDLPTTYRFAMTAPYYVESERPRISRRSVQFFLDWLAERARQVQPGAADRREVLERDLANAQAFWQGLLDQANAD